MDLGSTHSPSLSLLFSFFLLLTQNILYNTILYYILSYSQSKIFLLLTQNIYYYIIYSPLPVKNFSSADAEYILLYYIIYSLSSQKNKFFGCRRHPPPNLPQTPPNSPFFPQSPPQKKILLAADAAKIPTKPDKIRK